MIISEAMKITKAGQVTIPKAVREALKTDTIIFEISDNHVSIVPVVNIAGALRDFALTTDNAEDFARIRDAAWQEQTSKLVKTHE
jgi:AbrB family looped-hinge helix DNA binding protein